MPEDPANKWSRLNWLTPAAPSSRSVAGPPPSGPTGASAAPRAIGPAKGRTLPYAPKWGRLLLASIFFGAGGVYMARKAAANDRGLIINAQDGAVESSFDFPAEIRGMNSNHVACLIVVTTEGDVVLGEFDPAPQWSTLLMGDYVTAMIG